MTPKGKAWTIIVSGYGAAALLAGGWYWFSPLWAIDGIRQAASEADAADLSNRVDLTGLRDQLRLRLGQPGSGATASPNSPAEVIAAAVTDAVVNARMNLGTVRKLVLAGHLSEAPRVSPATRIGWQVTSRGVDTFKARAEGTGQNEAELVFHRAGFKWKLAGVNGIPELDLVQADRERGDDLVLDFPANRQDRRILPSGGEYIGLSGSITNTGQSTREVPSITVTMRDQVGRKIYSEDIRPSLARLKAGESQTINEALVGIPAEVATIELGWSTQGSSRSKLRFAVPSGKQADGGSGSYGPVTRLGDENLSAAEREALQAADEAMIEATRAASNYAME